MYNHSVVPISSPGCEFRFGIYAESNGCSTKYVKCADGYPNVQDCEPGLAYDDRIKKCNWPDLLLDICNPAGTNHIAFSKIRTVIRAFTYIGL